LNKAKDFAVFSEETTGFGPRLHLPNLKVPNLKVPNLKVPSLKAA
jgi:hypothetical protein